MEGPILMAAPVKTIMRCLLAAVAAALAACATPPPAPEIQSVTITPPPEQPEASEPASVEVTLRLAADALPAQPEAPPARPDLITAMAARFQLRIAERKEIARQREWFVRHPQYMQRVLLRSERYLYYILAELDRRNMPSDLALLPIVESAYDPFAYSHGRAAGMWQMIPGTARRFGVRQNWWYDGRRDVLDSTRAALDYLQSLNELFDGDWQLAIAAYNSGEGNVIRAIKRNAKAGRPTDFWHLRLPRETVTYVPKLLALVDIVSDPSAYGLDLPELPNRSYFDVVPLDGQMDLALIADLAGIDMDELYALNPGYNRWATDPEGPQRALVPVGHADQLAVAIADLPDDARMRWVRYRIRSGDSLITVAKRHGTTPEVLKEANGLKGNLIRAGDHLMIPTATQTLTAYTQSADLRLARTQSTPRGATKFSHTVAGGDSLWGIARQYGVSTRSLAKWNGMAPGDTLSVGRTLVVWADSGKTVSRPGTSPAAGKERKLRYTVRRGDSLYLIAQRFRVTVAQIQRWNNLDASRYLQPGQTLTVYVDVTRQSGG
jgi:membrane-bound lytic murein transglycosylase D